MKINGRLRAAALCVAALPGAADRVQLPHAGRDSAGGGTAACAPPFGRLRRIADCPERLAGGERPAEISACRATCCRPLCCRISTATANRTQRCSTPRPSHLQCLRCLSCSKNSGGAWQVSQTVEGLADTVDNVRLAQLAGRAARSSSWWAMRLRRMTTIWPFTPTRTARCRAILEQAYEQYLVEDITGGGSEDLILMSTLEDGGVQIELLTVDRDGSFQQVAVMGTVGRISSPAAPRWRRASGADGQALSGAGRLDRHLRQQSGLGAAAVRR